MRWFRSRFAKDRRGSVSVIASYFFIVMTGTSALTIQGSDMYVVTLQGQRTADLASQAAAVTTNPIVGGSPSATAVATALNIAKINGFSGSTVSTTATNSGTTIYTTITTPEQLFLSSVINAVSSASVFNNSTAKPSVPLTQGCVVALSGAVSVFNSGAINGSSCAVMANTNLTNASATVNVAGVAVGVGAASESGDLTTPATQSPSASNFMYNATLSSSIEANAGITAIKSHLAAMASWPYATSSPVTPSTPTVPSSSNNLYFTSGNNTIANGNYGTLTIKDVTSVTFQGSGGADPSCSNPTTFSGATYLYNGVNIPVTFNSGCYIFKGDFTNYWAHSMYAVAAPGASLTFIFEGSIVNSGGGGMQFPAGTFSIARNIDNSAGLWITLGNGSKVIGGTISNNSGNLNLSNGPFYLLGSSISNVNGAVTFGTGPLYVFNSTVTSGTNGSSGSQGSMSFGGGPYYFYNSTLNSGKLTGSNAPTLTFSAGNYYFYNSTIYLYPQSTTYFCPGNMDLYNTGLTADGSAVTFGYGGTASTGSSMISLNGGEFAHVAGNLTAQGVTIASTGNIVVLFGANLDLEAPTASNPTYGAQNIAIYSATGGVNLMAGSGGTDTMGGLIYAPNSTINIYATQAMNAPSGSCLETVGATVNVFSSATVNSVPCSGLTVTATGGVPLLQ